MLLQASVLAAIPLLSLTLAQDTSSICKDAPKDALVCCTSSTFAICENVTSICNPVPFSGTCIHNKLDMNFPDSDAAHKILYDAKIVPEDLLDSAAAPTDKPENIKRSPATKKTKAITTTKKMNKHVGLYPSQTDQMSKYSGSLDPDPTSVNNNLGLNGHASVQTAPPLACQVIGNVVFDRCDINNAIFDHWLGDDPCDYGC